MSDNLELVGQLKNGFYLDKPLELADRLDRTGFYIDIEGAAVIRKQHAEIEALRAENERLHMSDQPAALLSALRTLGKQDAENWALHEERDALRAERDALREALEEAVRVEREACAKFVDHILKEGGGTYGDAIRARGEKV